LLPCFLNDSNEDVESIAEQVMQSVNESNSSDEQSAQDAHIAIPKAVADGLYTAGKTAVILKK
jgi:pyruvate-formate lyase